MEKEQTDQMYENIRLEAARRTEALIYTLNNPYLTAYQKTEVELWFQLPIHIALITFFVCAIYSIYVPLPWYLLLGIPIAVNLVSGAILWATYHQKLVFAFYLTLTHNWMLWILTLISASWLAVTGHYKLAIMVILLKLILSAFLGWHIILYTVLARKYHMHPKYSFFKRFYAHKFPFEASA
ncbi:MAG: hypothetical protein Q8S46_05625 [Methylotenera sp.]|nr:hypothetical protein [Methylotenera sp.]MDZ4155967.1 hypothetical protein [Methylococcales bacterium]